MKKIICLIIASLLCFSLPACKNNANDTTSNTQNDTKVPNIPPKLDDLKQDIVNTCCQYSQCDSIKGLQVGTFDVSTPTEGVGFYLVDVKGSYYPVDDYGDLEDKMKFEITFNVTCIKTNGEPDYMIRVQNKYISRY